MRAYIKGEKQLYLEDSVAASMADSLLPIATICTSGFYISTNGRAIEVVEHLENDPLGYFSISNAINDNSLMPGPQIQCCVGGWSNVVWAGRGERKMFLSCSKIEFYSQTFQHLANCRLKF